MANEQPQGMDAVWKAVADNKPIEAIKLYRTLTGASLKDARDTVIALKQGATPPSPPAAPTPAAPAPPDAANTTVTAMERNTPPYLQPDSIEDIERRITHGGWQTATVPPAVWLIVLVLLGIIFAVGNWPGNR